MTKIMTICGTRPEIIRLSCIIPKLDKICEHILVYTGQNFNTRLKDIFFQDLGIRTPNYDLGAMGCFGEQIGVMFTKLECILKTEHPDKVLILGDTNSALCCIVAERLGIPVYHMEAGNRCGDKIAEEINRKIVDNTCTINLPYTKRSRDNLINEGFDLKRIFVTGNPIKEVIEFYQNQIIDSTILTTLNLKHENYILATLHRSENVDDLKRLTDIISAYNQISVTTGKEIIVSTHPRTQSKLSQLMITIYDKVRFLPAFGFFDFIRLEKSASCLLTDSGTCQEEAGLLHISCVVTRRATERTELIECGASILGGIEFSSILESYQYASKIDRNWELPKEYLDLNVSNKVISILMGEINV
jgi:UDP-N-acetylglucosamine 2-epimerase (non-hydrolysing)